MSLTPIQALALALLRGRRSPRSWIAGSAVLHPFLARHPGDLDIHHPDARAVRAAIRADLAILLEHGFAMDGSAWLETEHWARFRHDTGSVVLNWVVVEHPECAWPRRHPDFGYAVPVADAVAEKLEAARSFGRSKDLEDLRAISRARVPLPPDLGSRLKAFIARPSVRKPGWPRAEASMTASRPISIDEAALLARRRTLERLLRCAISEEILDGKRSSADEARGTARVSFETATGLLRLHCRPPFVGWRHAEVGDLILHARGSAPRPIEDPFDLISILRSLHLDGQWDRLRDEIENSLVNETLSIHARSERDHAIAEAARDSGCPTLLDWVRRSLPATEWTSFFEQWGAVGHPHHPCAKTRIGFTTEDSRRYAPEFGRHVSVPWLAVRRDRLEVEAASPDLDMYGFLTRHFPTAMQGWRRAVTASGADPEGYLPLPVHPWQWEAIVVRRFADEIAESDILKPDGVDTDCLAMLSLRTLAPVDAASSPCLKLPLSIQVTSSRRELVPGVVAAGPWMTRRLGAILKRDEPLRGTLAILDEPLGLHMRPAYPGDERSGLLSALLRQPVAEILRPGETAIPVAALFVLSPVTGKPLFLELAAAAGGGLASFFSGYCRIVLGAFLRLSSLHGIALEAHQQNTLVVVDERHRITRIVARDFGARVLAETIDPSDPIPDSARDMIVAERDTLREMVSHAVLESHVHDLVALLARHRAAAPAVSWRRAAAVIEEVFAGLAGELDAEMLEAERAALFGRPWRVKSLLRMRIAQHPADSFIDTRNPFALTP